ncbi:hypothetical protein AMECASPLE_035904 [Ameca splendens]|uniref:Uncharacterized protein n=1 Tax=Ameca splendens TaxID=208324 RepID=A0ABV1ADV8_9TELE
MWSQTESCSGEQKTFYCTISSVSITSSPRRVIDASTSSKRPEENHLLPPSIHPSIHSYLHPVLRCSSVFSPQQAPERPAPGPTVMESDHEWRRHGGGGG